MKTNIILAQPNRYWSVQEQKGRRWLGILWLALVFFLGVGTGIVATSIFVIHTLKANARQPIELDSYNDRYLRWLTTMTIDKLNLDTATANDLERELEETVRQSKLLRATIREASESIAVDAISRVRPLLPPEKRESYDRLMKEELGSWGIYSEK